MDSDELDKFFLDSIFIFGVPFNMDTYLITNLVIKAGYEFCGKLSSRKIQMLAPPILVVGTFV